MPGGDKKVTHTKQTCSFHLCVTFLLPPGIKGLNDYRKYPLNNSQNLLKNFFVYLVYVNCGYMKYLIFAVSRIYTNGYFMVTNQTYMS